MHEYRYQYRSVLGLISCSCTHTHTRLQSSDTSIRYLVHNCCKNKQKTLKGEGERENCKLYVQWDWYQCIPEEYGDTVCVGDNRTQTHKPYMYICGIKTEKSIVLDGCPGLEFNDPWCKRWLLASEMHCV